MPSQNIGNIGQVTVERHAQAVVGGLVNGDYLDALLTMLNDSAQAREVRTITCTAGGAGTVHTYTIDGETVTYTELAGDTDDLVATALYGVHITTPNAYGVATTTAPGANVITLTARTFGVAFTLTVVAGGLVAALVTSAASASDVEPGRGIVRVGFDSQAQDEASERGAIAASTLFTAQVATVTPVYAADTDTRVAIRDMHTGRIIADTIMRHDTGLADLIAELVAELNTQLPANSVLAADVAGTSMTLTAEVAGLEFDVEVGTGEGAAAAPSTVALAYTTGPSESTSVLRALRGVSVWDVSHETSALATADNAYPGTSTISVAKNAPIWVENTQTIVRGSQVYMEMGVAADNGKFFNTNSATRLALPLSMAKWLYGSVDTGVAGIAALQMSLA